MYKHVLGNKTIITNLKQENKYKLNFSFLLSHSYLLFC